ncbi:hypothetical protein Taro_006117 [Colocasia esculenta]|uniref:Uncharacterized protein n=1 Tax=Colocasia esculenta TaxID=4460 RepID=A0A843TRN3_COLES|nr:hypothetical protein [Colocasia esculenta]
MWSVKRPPSPAAAPPPVTPPPSRLTRRRGQARSAAAGIRRIDKSKPSCREAYREPPSRPIRLIQLRPFEGLWSSDDRNGGGRRTEDPSARNATAPTTPSSSSNRIYLRSLKKARIKNMSDGALS